MPQGGFYVVRTNGAAASAGEPLWAEVLASLDQDCAWHREWSGALLSLALARGASSRASVDGWREHRSALAERAETGLASLLLERS